MPEIRRRQALGWGASLLALSMTAMTHNLLAATPASPAPPAELGTALPGARLVGTGVLRFFGLRVYEARLWASAGFNPLDYARQPFALELVYDRKLEGEAIAERSIAEMRRVAPFSEDQGRQWLRMMKQAFPDVVAQDRLLGLNDGAGKVVFLHNGRETAAIDDALYARLFFGIWLSEQTSAPALRAALLGQG
ncbi:MULTISPECIES: chalcone isomerase family protein [Comamonas]|uniref:chalcone isomerase family protein n=1 Tax=Comamonas TaxID=283 RepID=UPI0015FA8389|nr:chalcone isomerase family protein [Comamonas koreensis]